MAKVVIDMDIQFGTCKTLGGGGVFNIKITCKFKNKILEMDLLIVSLLLVTHH
jgi:hypothetical protein